MNGITLFEVGGSIRDELLGITDIPDRDFCAVSFGGWGDLLGWANKNMNKVFQVKPEFLTIRGSIGKSVIDIVMCRKDGASSDGRHPDMVEPGTLMEDLERRDFTINAMAREVDSNLNPCGDIIDPFEGRERCVDGELRCVGSAEERFDEDGLRVIRAIRFSITKGMHFDKEITDCLMDPKWAHHLRDTVAANRIREELIKMFKHDTAASIRTITREMHDDFISILFQDTDLWLKPTNEKKKR